tara:strand:- start:126 stop:380 length:255 start_codon:yes stop_codon:yes gene_type:complete
MIKLVEVVDTGAGFNLKEIVVNSVHILTIEADTQMAGLHANGRLPEGLHGAQQFSKVSLSNGKQLTVIGTPAMIGQKAKNVLHG